MRDMEMYHAFDDVASEWGAKLPSGIESIEAKMGVFAQQIAVVTILVTHRFSVLSCTVTRLRLR